MNEPERELTLEEELREYMERRERECSKLLSDDTYRAPEHPDKLRPETARIMNTRRRLYEELVEHIDRGRLPE